jgi:hypothetical protein
MIIGGPALVSLVLIALYGHDTRRRDLRDLEAAQEDRSGSTGL